MPAPKRPYGLCAVTMTVVCLGLFSCDKTATSQRDSGAGGRGGMGGTLSDASPHAGGAGGGSGTTAPDAPVGTGGTERPEAGTGTGGRISTRPSDAGPIESGGSTGTGGIHRDGGQTAPDGKTGTGGSPVDVAVRSDGNGRDGGTNLDAPAPAICGGYFGAICPTAQLCDILDHCGLVADGSGHCVPASPTICDTVYAPVCGCDGNTYPNDCERGAARVQKFSDGTCAAGRDASAATDRNAGLVWQAAAVGASTGPGILVLGRGWYAIGPDTRYQDSSTLLWDGTPSYSLTNAELDDLFARASAIDWSALPHDTSGATGCNATLMVSTCSTCPRRTLTYTSAAQLVPEAEPVWAWFDQVLGSATIATNPRTYCKQ